MQSLIEFLSAHRVAYREGGTHKHVRPGWVGVDCPGCGPGSGRFHAGVREDLSRASCWRCGSLRAYELLSSLTGLPWWDVRKALGWPRRPLERVLDDFPVKSVVKCPPGLRDLHGPYRDYLESRGFDPDVAARMWGVRATGPAGRLSWRLWIPVTLDGEVVSWTTRAIGGAGPRYISASPEQEAVSHKALLYGEDLAGPAVVVVEGPLDAWAVGPGAVAIMGLMTTPKQVERIGRHPLRAVCCDSEPAALRRAERLARVLQQYPGETHVVELETGKDPAEAEEGELDEIRRRFLRPFLNKKLPL